MIGASASSSPKKRAGSRLIRMSRRRRPNLATARPPPQAGDGLISTNNAPGHSSQQQPRPNSQVPWRNAIANDLQLGYGFFDAKHSSGRNPAFRPRANGLDARAKTAARHADGPDAGRGAVLPARRAWRHARAAGFLRARAGRVDRLHGPRQLRDQYPGWRQIRLYAALGRAA